jgi:O-antigen/teichoic acid export membrane protein
LQRNGPSWPDSGRFELLLNLVRKFFSESLSKNFVFLILNLGVSAVCGYGSLTLLTHTYSVSDVGLSSIAATATSLVTSITQFGATFTLPRYLPTSKNRIGLINTLLSTVLLATALGAVIFLTLPYAKKFTVLGGGATFDIIFVIATCLSAVGTVVTTVLIADRSSDKVATFGVIPNVARLVAPSAFSALGGLGAFMARMIGDIFSVTIFGTILARRGQRFRIAIDREVVRDIAKFSTGMYFSTLVGVLPNILLPLIVLSRVGAQQTAYWSVAMSIGTLLFSLPSMLTQALLPEISLRPAERKSLLLRSVKLSTALMVPVLSIAFFGAPLGLAIFGKIYVSGALAPLRWLIVAGLVTMLNYASGAILFIAKKTTVLTVVNIINAVVVLGLVAFWATNVVEVAIAWTIGDIVNTVFFGLFAFIALRQVGGRWEKLGGESLGGESQAAAATAGVREPLLSATSQLRALDLLSTLAQQQRAAQMYRPSNMRLTDAEGLFSIAAMRAADRQTRQVLRGTASPVTGISGGAPGGSAGDRNHDGSRPAHEQALNVLFDLAARQEEALLRDPERYWADQERE